MLALGICACGADPIILEGQFGRPIPLATGDMSPLPRLVFVDEGCPGQDAVGGCPDGGDRQCEPVLIDSLAPLTAMKRDGATSASIDRECIEVRAAEGLAADAPTPEELDAAVTRFRFEDVPAIRAPAEGTDTWNWLAGDANVTIEPSAVLGGNLLRSTAVLFRRPRRGAPRVTFYGEFPGTEENLANAGRAYLPLQFPGRLLGRNIDDRCRIDDDSCELGFDVTPGRDNNALLATRMVLDACIAMPPCTAVYDRNRLEPFEPGTCELRRGPDEDAASCFETDDDVDGGETASLVVASGVSGMVLFSDSVERMFGPPAMLPACTEAAISGTTKACLVGNDGVLHLPGWPSAGQDDPLVRLRVRSVGLVPGVVDTRDILPCARAGARLGAAAEMCQRFVDAAERAGDVRNVFPPFSAEEDDDDGNNHDGDPASTSLVVLGEASLPPNAEGPSPDRWIDVTVLPETHPMVVALRRDTAPEAIEPDGLLGSVLFDDTETVLDYTDDNPGVRMTCIEPRTGDCYAAPECRTDGQAACCFGMPLDLVVDWIIIGGDDTCCPALSAGELMEIQPLGFCQGVSPP